jgi:hypothetical protein
MDMLHGHGHAAWTKTCSMAMDMQHEFDILDMQHGPRKMHHGHRQARWTLYSAGWTLTCSMDMDMHHTQLQHGDGHGH